MFKSTGTLRLPLQTWGERANGMKVYMSRLLGSVSDEIKKRIKLNAFQLVRVKQDTNFGTSCFFLLFKPQRGIYTMHFLDLMIMVVMIIKRNIFGRWVGPMVTVYDTVSGSLVTKARAAAV